MLLECILYVGVLHVASRERRSLRRGSGLLLTRTIRARSQRLQEMMDVPVHNLEWILQKQRQKSEQKSMHSSITRHDVRSVVHHSTRLIPAPWISKPGQNSVKGLVGIARFAISLSLSL